MWVGGVGQAEEPRLHSAPPTPTPSNGKPWPACVRPKGTGRMIATSRHAHHTPVECLVVRVRVVVERRTASSHTSPPPPFHRDCGGFPRHFESVLHVQARSQHPSALYQRWRIPMPSRTHPGLCLKGRALWGQTQSGYKAVGHCKIGWGGSHWRLETRVGVVLGLRTCLRVEL